MQASLCILNVMVNLDAGVEKSTTSKRDSHKAGLSWNIKNKINFETVAHVDGHADQGKF